MTAKNKLLAYKIALFAFAFLVAFLPSTVSRNREVNSRVIVEILGVDGGEDVKITAQYVMPSSAKEDAGKDVVTVSGGTLTEAVESLNTALGRRAELGHCSMVVVGSGAQPELFGTLMTSTDVTADVYLAAAQGKASELVGDITDFMKKTGATDADFIAYSAKKEHVATNTLLGFLSDLGSASKSAYIPVVEMLKSEGGGGSNGQGGGEQSKSGGEEQSKSGGEEQSKSGGEEQTGMKVEKLALYGRDGRAGVLNRGQARGVAWVNAPVEKGIVTADVEYAGRTVRGVTGRLLKKSANIKLDPGSDGATVRIKATVEPVGDKFNSLGGGAEAVAATRDAFSAAIKSEVAAAYRASAELGCDPLFIGRQFYRYEPDYFDSRYSPASVNVDIVVEVALK